MFLDSVIRLQSLTSAALRYVSGGYIFRRTVHQHVKLISDKWSLLLLVICQRSVWKQIAVTQYFTLA